MFKNVASQKIQVFVFDTSTNAPKTGDAANLTLYVSKDHGAVTVLGDTSATEMDATNAKGIYVFDLTQAETNADELTFTGKSTTANVTITPRFISTTPANFTAQSIDSNGRVDVIKIAGTPQTARDVGASVLLSSGTGTGQLDFTSGVVKANTTQLASQTVTAAAGVTFPTSVASPTNITAATGITVATNNDKTGYSLLATTGLGNQTSNITGNLSGSVGSVTGAVGSVTGNVGGSVGSVAAGGISASSFAANALTAAALATDAGAEIAVAVMTRMTEVGLTQAAGGSPGDLEFTIDALRYASSRTQVDVGLAAILSRLPTALVGGRIDASVGAMQNNTLTSAAIATDAIGASELASDAVTEIAAGVLTRMTEAGLTQSAGGSPGDLEFTQDALRHAATQGQLDAAITAVLARLPAALVGGRMDSSTGAMQANVLTAAALAADASTEISASVLTTLRDVGVLELAAGSPGDYRFTTDALVNAPTSTGGGGSGLDAAGTRAALGMAAANLDAQLATIAGYVDTEVLAIKSTTDALFSLLEPATGSPSEYRLTADALQRSTTVLGLAAGDLDAQFAQVIGAMPSSAALADAVLDEALAGHMIAGSAGRAIFDADKRGARVTLHGAVGAAPAPTTTQFTPSSLDATCSSVNQFLGRVIVFDKDTTTIALQGQAAVVIANNADALPLLTFDALTSAPVAGDTFSIV